MAQLGCDLCEDEPAIMLQTSIEDGQVIAVGGACLFSFYLGAARGIAAAMPDELKGEYLADIEPLAAEFGIGVAPVPAAGAKARGKRAGKESPPAGDGEPGPPAGGASPGEPDGEPGGGA
jgi:hypothetical protein